MVIAANDSARRDGFLRHDLKGPSKAFEAFRQSLFGCLPESELIKLAILGRYFELPRGPLFLEGDVSSNAYLLVSGKIDISVFSADGRELLLYRVKPGGFFGELALLDDQPRSSSAICRTKCEIVAISRSTLVNVLSQNAELALRMIVSLSHRLKTADQTIKAVTFHDMTARLAILLLSLESEQAKPGVVQVSHEELANALGCARQSVTRTISVWRRIGYVETGRGRILIRNRRKLQGYVEE